MAITLDEAIKLIQADINDEGVEWNSPLGEAYKLGFEGLLREKSNRENPDYFVVGPLPGERKE